ncbi:hypothetical protein [Nereida ignava]|uniref:hypothetical protein n=1 Tax=Nereida ignava TaxID=282199 RepID=UPI0030FCDF30
MSQRARQTRIRALAEMHRQVAPGLYLKKPPAQLLQRLLDVVEPMENVRVHGDVKHLVHLGRCLELYFMHCGEPLALKPVGTAGPRHPTFDTRKHVRALSLLWEKAEAGPRPPPMYGRAAGTPRHEAASTPGWQATGVALIEQLDAMLEYRSMAVIDEWAPVVIHWVQLAELSFDAHGDNVTVWLRQSQHMLEALLQRWEHAVLQSEIRGLWSHLRRAPAPRVGLPAVFEE